MLSQALSLRNERPAWGRPDAPLCCPRTQGRATTLSLLDQVLPRPLLCTQTPSEAGGSSSCKTRMVLGRPGRAQGTPGCPGSNRMGPCRDQGSKPHFPISLHFQNTNAKMELLGISRWCPQSTRLQVWGGCEHRPWTAAPGAHPGGPGSRKLQDGCPGWPGSQEGGGEASFRSLTQGTSREGCLRTLRNHVASRKHACGWSSSSRVRGRWPRWGHKPQTADVNSLLPVSNVPTME